MGKPTDTSVETEILDQLLGGGLSLKILRMVSPSDERFLQAILGLLRSGDLIVLGSDGSEVADWRWRALFRDGEVMAGLEEYQAQITDQGAERVI